MPNNRLRQDINQISLEIIGLAACSHTVFSGVWRILSTSAGRLMTSELSGNKGKQMQLGKRVINSVEEHERFHFRDILGNNILFGLPKLP